MATARSDLRRAQEELPASVVLMDVPMEGICGRTVCGLIDVLEEAALLYELLQDK